MCKYSVLRDDLTGIITYMVLDVDGYTFTPKMDKSDRYITISSVTIYDKHMIDILLNRKFEIKFDKLSQIIMKFLYEEDDSSDEGDFIILLDEVARLEALVENKYKRFLEVEEYKNYIHRLAFLDSQLREKIMMINYRDSLYNEVRQGRSM